MKTQAIVASAGVGKRLRAAVRKPYISLRGIPVLIRTLKALAASRHIDGIVVVANPLDRDRCAGLIRRYKVGKVVAVVAGGKERSDSVRNGLAVIDPDTDIVLIHDGVRPFIDEDVLARSIACAARRGASVVGVPVKATIKKVTSHQSPATSQKKYTVKETIDRNDLWEIQTPQVFKKELIVRAYKQRAGAGVTDDSMLVERLGVKPEMVLGSYYNIKITTPEDLVIAAAIVRAKKNV